MTPTAVAYGSYRDPAISPQPPAGRLKNSTPAFPANDERELVEQAKRNPSQFAALYDRHFLQIYRFAYSRVGDQIAAEDITSEVFMKALGAMPRYQDTGRPFSAWLYRIAVNTILDRCRTLRSWQPIEDVLNLADGSATEDVAVNRDEISRIWDLVDRLPNDQRTAMALKFKDDMSILAIAAAMSKSPGAVKLLIHRGVRRLRTHAERLRPVEGI